MMQDLIPLAAATAVLCAVVSIASSFVANRQHVRKLRAAGAPMPKYHPVLGHLLVLKEYIQGLPKDTTMHVVMRRISEKFQDGVFYLNLWPFNPTIMVISDSFLGSQVEAAYLDKPEQISSTLEIINGGPSLQTMRGSTWKRWRTLFNPGFASGYMTGLVPAIAEEVEVFCNLLAKRANRGDVFQLEEHTLRLTFDIIGRVTLDARLRYQTQGSALADCLRRQVYWSTFGTTFNPFRRYLSPRPLVQMYNSFRMNQYLDTEIDKRFDELALSRRTKEAQSPSRSIISLVMDSYLGEMGHNDELSKSDFKRLAKPHLRMFLYAGHDTTSSTLLYCFHLLSQHPEILAKVRAEHEEILGSDSSSARLREIITNDPSLLNKLPYTLAVIKEVLRLFPPAGLMRQGRPDITLSGSDGQRYPTAGCYIWVLSLAMHHNPKVFERPEDFLPERWLVGSDDPLHPKKGSWRPFEWGQRNCIGQTLAVLELKIVLAMTLRTFNIRPAYEEWDHMHPPKGVKTVDGNRVYQAERGGGGARPADGFPVKVMLRKYLH